MNFSECFLRKYGVVVGGNGRGLTRNVELLKSQTERN